MTGEKGIRIDRLALRLRGVPVATARAATAGLGADLGARLAAADVGSAAIGDLRLGRVAAPLRATPAEVRRAVADTVADAVVRAARGEER